MRFTLQHVLLWLASCLLLCAVNLAIGGHATLFQGFFTLVVCGMGALWGIWRYRRKHPDIQVAPLKPVIKGIVVAVVLSVLGGYVFGSHLYEVCTRTHEQRETQNLGVLCFMKTKDNEESAFIRTTLNFHPQEHNWVPVTQYLFGGVGDWMPMFRYPMLNLNMADLRVLARLQPSDRCHALFQFDNPIDCQFAHMRDKALWVLRYRLGQNGGQRSGGTDEEIVTLWWSDFKPFLRPLHSTDDLKRAITEFRTSQHSKDFGPYMQAYINQELSPYVTMVGLPP